MRAIEGGNQFQIKAAQEFYLRANETLRRLDLAVETERRKSDEQVAKALVEDFALEISKWLRLSFERFLSAESPGLMAIADLGEFSSRQSNGSAEFCTERSRRRSEAVHRFRPGMKPR
jgi:hypothetical protein